jgi:excisionase family DNA binding protein
MKYALLDQNDILELSKQGAKLAIKEMLEHLKNNKENKDEILNADQAAKLLKIAKQTLYSKTSRQEIPFMKRGKKLIFKKSDLLEYLEKGRYLTNAQIEAKANDYINNK